MATITITVTVAGGKFVLDGVSQATYSATPGNTYKFDQAEDGIRDLVRSRGLGDVYKRQAQG